MTDYSRAAIETRLREVARETDLSAECRLNPKIGYDPMAIERRLRTVEALRRACLALGTARPL